MKGRVGGAGLFVFYVVASAIPISGLGLGLSHMYRSQMNAHVLDQARDAAHAIANAGIEPVLAGGDLTLGLTDAKRAGLEKTTRPLLRSGSVIRLRLRDRNGVVSSMLHTRIRDRSVTQMRRCDRQRPGAVFSA